jgi:hypothetical protein
MFENLLDKHPLQDNIKEGLVKNFVNYISTVDRKKTSPEVARDLHKKIMHLLKNDDLYAEEKKLHNDFVLNMYPELKNKIENAEDPLETAVKIAISGNIIDFGPSQDFNVSETINKVLNADFAINHSKKLLKDLSKAKKVLYLGDNTGEIVMDRLFIEMLQHPNLYYAVRGKPIINDITMEDAIYTGIDKIANVISNGDDTPSTVLKRVSPEFLDHFHSADVIISKGQGNLEGLIDENMDNIYFLLMVKCDVIGNILGVKKGDYVVANNQFINR